MFKAKLNIVRSERERERKNQLTVRRRHSKKRVQQKRQGESKRERASARRRTQRTTDVGGEGNELC